MEMSQKETIGEKEDFKQVKGKRLDDIFDSIVRSERFLIGKIRDNLPYVFYEEEANDDIADFLKWVRSMEEFLIDEDKMKLDTIIRDLEGDLRTECEYARNSVKEYKSRNNEIREQAKTKEAEEIDVTQSHLDQEVAIRERTSGRVYESFVNVIKRTNKQIRKELMLGDKLGLAISLIICILMILLIIENGKMKHKNINLVKLSVLTDGLNTSTLMMNKIVEALILIITFALVKTAINEYLIRMCFD